MEHLDQKQLDWAFRIWYLEYKFQEIDQEIVPYLDKALAEVKFPQKRGWIKNVRQAQFLSLEEIGLRLGLGRSAINRLEKNEADGKITLQSLAKVADALDCELVYALRPKRKKKFSEMLWERLYRASIGHNWVQTRPKHNKAGALAAIVKIKMNDPKFREIQKWTQRKA